MKQYQYCLPEMDPDEWLDVAGMSFMDAAEKAAEWDDMKWANYSFAKGEISRIDIRDVDTGEIKQYTISVRTIPTYSATEIS